MAYIKLNENPFGLNTGDCVIRALTTALNLNWFMVHDELDLGSIAKGFKEYKAEDKCPNCLTVKEFADNHPKGRYILSTAEYTKANESIFVTGTHVVAVIDGDYYDTWDSGGDVPLSFFIVG